MEEGGICLWDLEEAESRHPSEAVGGAQLCTRRPAYTTECSPDMASSGAPVVSVVAVPRGVVFGPWDLRGATAEREPVLTGALLTLFLAIKLSRFPHAIISMLSPQLLVCPTVSLTSCSHPTGGSRSTPCYLYSLTAWGDVAVWTISVLSRAEAASVDLDLGMRIGSCVRLVRVAANVRLGMSALQSAAPVGLLGLVGPKRRGWNCVHMLLHQALAMAPP